MMKFLTAILLVACSVSWSFALSPSRYTAGEVGLVYPDSQDMLLDTHTGLPANQYQAQVRSMTHNFIWLAPTLRALRDIPSCQSTLSGVIQGVRDDLGKFHIAYSLRAMGYPKSLTRTDIGGIFQFTPNYRWDIAKNIFTKLRTCILSKPVDNATLLTASFKTNKFTPDLLDLLDLQIANGKVSIAHRPGVEPISGADRSHMGDGTLNAQTHNPPLTDQQCFLLSESHRLHDLHASYLLAHNQAAADAMVTQVVQSQLDFESTARTVQEQTLFSMVFTGEIDTARSQSGIDALTMETMQFHHEWAEGFQCATHGNPNSTVVWAANVGHARAHFLRAAYIPALTLRTVCGLYIDYCPVTGD